MSSENSQGKPKKGEVLYSFPEHSITVYATSIDEAEKKLVQILNSREEKDND